MARLFALLLFLFSFLFAQEQQTFFLGVLDSSNNAERCIRIAAERLNKTATQNNVLYERVLPNNVFLKIDIRQLRGDSVADALEHGRQLIVNQSVHGVIGPFFSNQAIAYSEQIATAYRKPFISWGAAASELTSNEKHPYFLRTIQSNDEQAEAVMEVAYVLQKHGKIGVFTSNELFSTDLLDKMKEKQDKKYVKIEMSVQEPIEQTDFTQALGRLKNAGIKILIIIPSSLNMTKIMMDIDTMEMRAGYMILFSTIEDSYTQLYTHKTNNKLLLGTMLLDVDAAVWHSQKYLRDALQELYPPLFCLLAYDAGKLCVDIINFSSHVVWVCGATNGAKWFKY